MADLKTVYNEEFGIDTFKRIFIEELGEEFWNKLTEGMVLPDIHTESQCQCSNMHAFIKRLESMADKATVHKILSKVRHGLTPSQCSGAREAFLEVGDLDKFIQNKFDKDILYLEELNRTGKDFYGDTITDEVLDFLRNSKIIISGVREGNKLFIKAFPANMGKYLQADNEKMKRYYACHCPFAKESILADQVVSSTLCSCSFGHVVNYWEAVFDQELEGEVLKSALAGDLECRYFITIPKDIMEQYVKE